MLHNYFVLSFSPHTHTHTHTLVSVQTWMWFSSRLDMTLSWSSFRTLYKVLNEDLVEDGPPLAVLLQQEEPPVPVLWGGGCAAVLRGQTLVRNTNAHIYTHTHTRIIYYGAIDTHKHNTLYLWFMGTFTHTNKHTQE